jgi:CelD/BcsL family acetyltransferase involved in cellulose biosynthesis
LDVRRLTTPEQLAALQKSWQKLDGGMPFRSWEWLATWWQHYSRGPKTQQLYTLACYEGGALVAVAPWYRRRIPLGWMVRALGDGEICSDYLGVPCVPGRERAVAAALAEHLTAADGEASWDLLRLCAQDAADPVPAALLAALRARAHAVSALPGPRCWRVELPAALPGAAAPADELLQWTQYLSTLSRSHRGQARRCERRCSDLGGELHVVNTAAELAPAFEILVDLHQRRRAQQGERGVFGSPQVLSFHRDAAARLLAAGRLWLAWLEVQGRPIAAQYGPRDAQTLYVYQSGIEPAALELEPGRMMLMQTLRYALRNGIASCDLLRGDEPYKGHFRATPRPCHELIIAHRHLSGRLSYHALAQGRRLRSWARGVRSFLQDRLRPSPG